MCCVYWRRLGPKKSGGRDAAEDHSPAFYYCFGQEAFIPTVGVLSFFQQMVGRLQKQEQSQKHFRTPFRTGLDKVMDREVSLEAASLRLLC